MRGLWFTVQLRVGCSKVVGEILSCWKQIASFRGTIEGHPLMNTIAMMALAIGGMWGH